MSSQLILLLFCIIWYFSRGLRKDNHIWSLLGVLSGSFKALHCNLKSVNFHPHILHLYVIIKFKFSLTIIARAVTAHSIRWYSKSLHTTQIWETLVSRWVHTETSVDMRVSLKSELCTCKLLNSYLSWSSWFSGRSSSLSDKLSMSSKSLLL